MIIRPRILRNAFAASSKLGVVPTLKTLLFAGILMSPGMTLAEGSKASENYEKVEKLLPGEKVVTPTGQKKRVWSTKGPVEVSPAPEPFKDPDRVRPDEMPIIIDADAPRRSRSKSSQGRE